MRKTRTGWFQFFLGCILLAGPAVGFAGNPDPGAAEKYGWGFRNFPDTVFSWDIYSHSFFGIPVDSNGTWLSATFDKLYYELGFRMKLPNPDDDHVGIGNCYGICLLSLMVNRFGGYYGYCAPTSAWKGDTNWSNAKGPLDPALHRVVNIMHGRQMSLGSIQTYIDQFAGFNSMHCQNAVGRARETIAKEGPCIVTLSETQNPIGGGHALIAYGVTDEGGGHSRIWIVDPNRLWAVPTPRDRGWYQLDSNYIDCNMVTGSWSFIMKGPQKWPTDPMGGNLMILPLSLVGPPGRSPSSLGLAAVDLLSQIMLTDGAPNADAEGFLRHARRIPEVTLR